MFGFRKKKNKGKEEPQIHPEMQQAPPRMIDPKRIHESGYVLRDGEQIVAAQKVLSPKGDGWLLATNIEFLYIHDKEGIYLSLNHSMIESLTVETGNKIKVVWNETNGKFDYLMKIKAGAQTAQDTVSHINEMFHYAGSSVQHVELSESQTDEARKKHVARLEDMVKQENRRVRELEPRLDGIADDDSQKQQKKLDLLSQIHTSKEKIRICEKNIEYAERIPMVRSYKIPQNVDDGNVWNDCYYDKSRKGYVCFRKSYESVSNARTREIQIKFDSEIGNNAGIIIEEEKTRFMFGYPVILRKDQNRNPVWDILCTMTDEMLTDEIVHARLRPKSHEESVFYETDSEQWITVGTKGMRICEKESEIGQRHKIFLPTSMEFQRQLHGRPYDEKLPKKELAELESRYD